MAFREAQGIREYIRGEEVLATPCCYCGANKGLIYHTLFLLIT